MNRKERIFALIDNKPVDRTPVGFWLHFPQSMHHGEAAVKAHMDFMRESNTDILKVMNENILYDGVSKIYGTSDIHLFRGFSRKDAVFQDQMKIIRDVAERAGGEYPIIATIHGLVVSAFHQTGFSGNYTSMGYGLPIFCRERPAEMHRVFDIIAETLMELVDCSLEAGADGIFYAALGGERNFFTDEEFDAFVKPYEKKIYDHIKSRTRLDVLHICKSNIAMERFAYLEPAIVNWGVYQNGVSLNDGTELFPNSVILGGFPDRHGVLVDGSDEEIYKHTQEVLAEMQGHRFIVGSDCTLPTEIDTARIRSVVKAVEALEECRA